MSVQKDSDTGADDQILGDQILDEVLSFLEKLNQSKRTLISHSKGPTKWIESNHKIEGLVGSYSNLKSVIFIIELNSFKIGKVETSKIMCRSYSLSFVL